MAGTCEARIEPLGPFPKGVSPKPIEVCPGTEHCLLNRIISGEKPVGTKELFVGTCAFGEKPKNKVRWGEPGLLG